jgi:hypothetical protein
MAQQTAVESIIADLNNECKARGMFVNWDMYLAMEKEQIIEAYGVGADCDNEWAQDYYNENYNK